MFYFLTKLKKKATYFIYKTTYLIWKGLVLYPLCNIMLPIFGNKILFNKAQICCKIRLNPGVGTKFL